MSRADFAEPLGEFLRRHAAIEGEVGGLRRLSGGASRETFAFEVAGPTGVKPFVLQRVRRGALSESFSMEGEASLLAAAGAAGVPVARVVAASDDRDTVGAQFMVLDFIEGETIGRRILRDDRYAAARQTLVRDCAQALAAIHALPLDAGPHLREDDPLTQVMGLLDSLGEPHPAFELAFRWLVANRPDAVPQAVVHGDFRMGNLIVGPTGLEAVVDWELAHIGDPREDLGWFCVKAWRFGEAAPVAGLGSYDELLSAYAEASGTSVDADAVRWWEVLGTVRWGVICILQARTHLSGMSRSVELATIGRRVCENEYDALELIAPDLAAPEPLPDHEAGTAAPWLPHDAPSALELVQAVREFIEGEVAGATEGRVHFHARVAANALSMVERELALAPALERRHRERLDALGFDTDASLAGAIRSGTVDDRRHEIIAAVRDAVVDKLRVANPRWIDPAGRGRADG